ncbi:MAG: hypothetical protein HQK50_05680 [Oligoflexia bacterium]|nr:hypothetical protein [Oligoflexia bacterium]MBF0365040.1 hypothetical protein [Oligoflexia bacterium]
MKASNITHSMIHYLFTIHLLCEKKERSRLIDLAATLKVARSSVTIAIKKLKVKKLVIEDEDHNLHLTNESHKIVHNMLSNRTLLFYFFKDFLGVSKKIAEKDACFIENILSTETQEKLFHFMKKTLNCNEMKLASESSKATVDLCLCRYSGLQDFKSKQEGDSYLADRPCPRD